MEKVMKMEKYNTVGLTPMMQKFADYYLQTANATQSVVLAGYSVNPSKKSYELLRHPTIVAYIEERNRAIAKKSEKEDNKKLATILNIKNFWSDIMFNENMEIKDRLKASELLAKTYGLFIDKIQISGKVMHSTQVDFSKMTDEELRVIMNGDNTAICHNATDGDARIN